MFSSGKSRLKGDQRHRSVEQLQGGVTGRAHDAQSREAGQQAVSCEHNHSVSLALRGLPGSRRRQGRRQTGECGEEVVYVVGNRKPLKILQLSVDIL